MESGVNPHRYPGCHTAVRRTSIALSTPATPGYTVADALQLESASAPSQIDDLHPDHLGTVRAITDTSQRVVWRWDSTPFGDTLPKEDPDGDGDGQALRFNLRFPGQYFDTETGLHYNYFRDYDPATGRYVQSDPIGLRGGLNTYAYVGGNPVVSADPLGLILWKGTMTSTGGAFVLGKSYFTFVLHSECHRFKRVSVRVEAEAWTIGVSAKYVPAGAAVGSVVFDDKDLSGPPNPSNLEPEFSITNVFSGQLGESGVGRTNITLGRATSISVDIGWGLDATLFSTSFGGKATVVEKRIEDCNCYSSLTCDGLACL